MGTHCNRSTALFIVVNTILASWSFLLHFSTPISRIALFMVDSCPNRAVKIEIDESFYFNKFEIIL